MVSKSVKNTHNIFRFAIGFSHFYVEWIHVVECLCEGCVQGVEKKARA